MCYYKCVWVTIQPALDKESFSTSIFVAFLFTYTKQNIWFIQRTFNALLYRSHWPEKHIVQVFYVVQWRHCVHVVEKRQKLSILCT